MSIINNVNGLLHRIRVKLYPNYLPNIDGKYIARTDNEACMTIEQICASMKDRGGFTGNYDMLVESIKQFNAEAAYQLCDGFAVNYGYFSIHPNIGGTFNSLNDIRDPQKNPINFRFRVLMPLRNLARHITIELTAIADGNAFIHEFIDRDEEAVNSIFVPDNMFCINGNKIKIAGDHPDCGIYFVPVEDPSKAVKVKRIGENKPSIITGIAPDTGFQHNRLEIRTQYTGSGMTFLKRPRIITSDFILETA